MLLICYLNLISFSYLTNNTYSYFSDGTTISGSVKNSGNFCADKDYKKEHRDLCKDNSGLGNDGEPVDEDDIKHCDEDNPGHQDECCPDGGCNDHNNGNGSDKKKPKEKKPITIPEEPKGKTENGSLIEGNTDLNETKQSVAENSNELETSSDTETNGIKSTEGN